MNVGHAGLTKWGLDRVRIAEDTFALDVGCGGGGTLKRIAKLAERGRIIGLDYSEDSIAVARRTNRRLIPSGRVSVWRGEVSLMPLSERVFDLVTVIETHYFWQDLSAALVEILRVMKPGAQVVIIGGMYKDPKFDRRNLRFVNAIGLVYLSPEEFTAILERAGYGGVRVPENRRKGWVRALGIKPPSRSQEA